MSKVRYSPQDNVFVADEDAPDRVLPQVMWHVTDRCPLNCGYCFSAKDGRELRAASVPDIVKRLVLLGVQKVDISGGEPLTSPALGEVVSALEDARIAATLTTSGVGPVANLRWLISNAQRFARVIVSIDAGIAADHNRLRRHPSAFTGATSLVHSLKSAGHAGVVRINTVLVKESTTAERLRSLARMAADAGPIEWCIIQPHPALRKADYSEHDVDDALFRHSVEEIRALMSELGASTVRLLSRRAGQYSHYWVLDPDGTLRALSAGSTDRVRIALLDAPVEELSDAICELGVEFPFASKEKDR